MVGGELFSFREHLQRQRGGRERQRQPGHEGRSGRQAERQSRAAEDQPGEQHLGAAQAEHRTAQRPQARRLQLQADDEQQQHHAQFGKVQGGFDLADEAEHARTDQDAGNQIAQHRAQAQAFEQRHGDDRRRQEHDRLRGPGHVHRFALSCWEGGVGWPQLLNAMRVIPSSALRSAALSA